MTKLLSFVLTLVIQFVLLSWQLLDNFYVILSILIGCIVVGLFIKYTTQFNERIKDMGWGLLFGTITVGVILATFLVWFSYYYPKC